MTELLKSRVDILAHLMGAKSYSHGLLDTKPGYYLEIEDGFYKARHEFPTLRSFHHYLKDKIKLFK